MTTLTRKVRREVAARRGPLVVTLSPGADPLIEVREKGRLTGFAITVGALYVILAQRQADAARAARRERRKA